MSFITKSLCYHARGVPQVVFGDKNRCHLRVNSASDLFSKQPEGLLFQFACSRLPWPASYQCPLQQPERPWKQEDFRESRLRFSDSLNGQRWIFLKKGLDDFRDGFPPSSDNMIVYGRKRPVSITLQNRTLKSLSTVPHKKRKKCAKTQVCLSKLSLLQQARRDYVAQIECCLNQQPLILYPRLEKSISAKKIDFEIKKHSLSLSLIKYEPHRLPSQVLTKTSLKKKPNKQWSDDLRVVISRKSSEVLFRFCDSVCTAYGMRDKCEHDERTLRSGFLQVLSQTKWEKIRYGAWYLDPKTWRKQKANEPLKAPEATINSMVNIKKKKKVIMFFCDISMKDYFLMGMSLGTVLCLTATNRCGTDHVIRAEISMVQTSSFTWIRLQLHGTYMWTIALQGK
uniref:Uncharacterized protein n=1 Tax=Aquila chrysaetos chrysaetos TaxID=223781 RepID=A0A663FE74_AQUCH